MSGLVEAWLIYDPLTGQLYYHLGERAFDAVSLQETPLPTSFGVPLIQVNSEQRWDRQPAFIKTERGWAIDLTEGTQFAMLASSGGAIIDDPIVEVKLFNIPQLTHLNTHENGTHSLDPVVYQRVFSPLLLEILQYLQANRLPMRYDVLNRRAILRALRQGD